MEKQDNGNSERLYMLVLAVRKTPASIFPDNMFPVKYLRNVNKNTVCICCKFMV